MAFLPRRFCCPANTRHRPHFKAPIQYLLNRVHVLSQRLHYFRSSSIWHHTNKNFCFLQVARYHHARERNEYVIWHLNFSQNDLPEFFFKEFLYPLCSILHSVKNCS